MTTIKTKKTYEKPAMMVYLLKVQPQLLNSSLPKDDFTETDDQW